MSLTLWSFIKPIFKLFTGIPDMPLLNLSVVSTRKTHIPWTVVQIEPGLTFCQLLLKILGTTYPILPVDEVLSRSKLDKVFVGNSRECQSIVDDNLVIDDVCAAFGQHVKYLVMESEPIASAEQVSHNDSQY